MAIQKTYIGLHDVAYSGQYDGEGRLWGMWQRGPDTGRWIISLRHGQEEAELSTDVVEIVPPRHPPAPRHV